MYNPHQTRHGRRISNLIIISLTALLFLMYACAGCVSAKQYKRLEQDYQNCGRLLRTAEQDAKRFEVELQDAIQRTVKRDRL